jgi:hypothetical protein
MYVGGLTSLLLQMASSCPWGRGVVCGACMAVGKREGKKEGGKGWGWSAMEGMPWPQQQKRRRQIEDASVLVVRVVVWW